MAISPERERVLELQDLIVSSENVAEFLEHLSVFAAAAVSRDGGSPVEVAVTLKRRRRTDTVAGSSEHAIKLDRIEQQIGDGPCIEALRVKGAVLLGDVRSDPRWPDYQAELEKEGVLSTLGLPLEIGEDSSAAINFFAYDTTVFTEDIVREAADFTDIAGRAVRLAVRIGSAENLADDLKAAMESRTSINLACGVIMGQNRCSQQEAMAILGKVSSNRNQKLRDVAEEMLANITGEKVSTHFEG